MCESVRFRVCARVCLCVHVRMHGCVCVCVCACSCIFPSLFRFALCLRCRTGLCPRDLEDYGCSCRYLGGRGTVDDMDGCCFRHRGCYRAVTERGCRSQPDTTTYSVTCGHSNVTCGKGTDPCARDWCLCDKAAIECMGRSPYHPSWRHLDSASCSSGPATGNCSVPRFTNYISQNPPLAFKTCKTIMFVKYTFCK
uniref:Phospholipase A2 n=1 Tax=Paramormyrops kingsleyae TaxID=1676925 RepID=A0A3B3S1W6_9TELE